MGLNELPTELVEAIFEHVLDIDLWRRTAWNYMLSLRTLSKSFDRIMTKRLFRDLVIHEENRLKYLKRINTKYLVRSMQERCHIVKSKRPAFACAVVETAKAIIQRRENVSRNKDQGEYETIKDKVIELQHLLCDTIATVHSRVEIFDTVFGFDASTHPTHCVEDIKKNVLGFAAVVEDLTLLQQMMSENVDLNAPGDMFGLPLHAACVAGQVIAVEFILNSGANIEIQDDKGMTPLSSAIKYHQEKVVKLLLDRGANWRNNASPDQGSTALHLAIRNGVSCTIIRHLLDHNVDVDEEDEFGKTALQQAALMDTHVCVFQLLLENDASVDATSDGWTALHFAAQGGHLRMLKLLIEHGSDIDRMCDRGTAMHIAILRHHIPIIEYLCEKKANLELGIQTPLYLAVKMVRFYRLSVVRLLVENGADINARAQNERNRTPLWTSVFKNDFTLVKFLLDHGADLEAKADNDYTVLLFTIGSRNHYEMAEYLIEHGANVRAKSEKGLEPLDRARNRSNAHFVRLLLSKGSNEIAKNI